MSVSPQKCSAGTFQLVIATLLPAFERPMMVVSNGGMAIFPVEASVSTQSPGSPLKFFNVEPSRYDEMRSGCFDVHERVRDMSAGGQLGGLNFPNFPGFAAPVLSAGPDRAVNMAMIRAYNDWHIEEWAGAYPDRLIPCGVLPLFDPELAAEEVRRLAAAGCHAVTFSENPTALGAPSIHSGGWDPVFRAASDVGSVLCCHVGSSARSTVTTADAPPGVTMTLVAVAAASTMADLMWADFWNRFPDLEILVDGRGYRVDSLLLAEVRTGQSKAPCLAQLPTTAGSFSQSGFPRSDSVLLHRGRSGGGASRPVQSRQRLLGIGLSAQRDSVAERSRGAGRKPFRTAAANHRQDHARKCDASLSIQSVRSSRPGSLHGRLVAGRGHRRRRGDPCRAPGGSSRLRSVQEVHYRGPIEPLKSPLDTIVVVDLSDGISGAYATKMFVDAGAAVFIGEPPEGATLRRSADPGERALFEFLTHGKSSIVVINWLDSLDLACTADVVVEDGLPQTQLDDLLEIGLVVVSLSPFGRSGPLARRRASELTIQAESGCLATRGDKSGMPFQAGGHIIEWVTGSYAAVAALAALQREVGEHIDVSMLEVAALTGTNFLSVSHELAGRPPIETPVRVIEAPEIHASSDGWVGFTTNSAQQFQDFLVMIGRPDLLSDAELATAAGRQARLDEFRKLVHGWTTKRTTDEIVAEASALRIPVAPVLNGKTVVEFPNL